MTWRSCMAPSSPRDAGGAGPDRQGDRRADARLLEGGDVEDDEA